jgi:FAD dependent oxidoreductase
MNKLTCCSIVLALLATQVASAQDTRQIDTELLVVGGTESGWAAAIQAARMGVPRIVLVNDIQWLGGQMTAEALVAIDENRSAEKTRSQSIRREPSIPRSGLFKELTDRIEQFNREKYGHPSPGNTIVGTTCRPAEAEAIFQQMIRPYVERGQIRIISNHVPIAAELTGNGRALRRVRFRETNADAHELVVNAKVTIDATDWGDVIQLSGASYEYGPDLKSRYNEPLAPVNREGYPLTDMNPISYCMVLEETESEQVIRRPAMFDERRYLNTTQLTKDEHDVLSWQHRPHAAFASVDQVYRARRIVDHYGLKNVKGPDTVLLCWFVQDYPLDILPKHVVELLETNKSGASKKNIVMMTPEQRRIVFDDAKLHSLGMLYHLQTTVHDRMQDKSKSFRRMRLSEEFGTPDHLPFKPYIRESLRLKAMYMMRQQDTTPLGAESETYARAMYHDGVTAWQFEYDFHMTGRTFLTEDTKGTAWQSYFKKGRTWGPPYAGLSLFPLRSLIPEKVDGLLGAQKNLGYSSIVSSAVRLHDQCIHIGQAAGAAAAVSLKAESALRAIPFDQALLTRVRIGLCNQHDTGLPMALWPFRDLTPGDEAYVAANLLAVSGLLPLRHDEVDFRSDDPATKEWRVSVIEATGQIKQQLENVEPMQDKMSRGQFAIRWWNAIRNLPNVPFDRRSSNDADLDGVLDVDDALPLDPNNASLPMSPQPPHTNGIPDKLSADFNVLPATQRQFNFTPRASASVSGFVNDIGLPFDKERGYGWSRDISENSRRRNVFHEAYRDTFLFTREADRWECVIPSGTWAITLCVGDAAHEQAGQFVNVENVAAVKNVMTAAGRFFETTYVVEINDGRLTIDLGPQQPGRNTCLNWIRLVQTR